MEKRVALVSGGTRGIGRAIAQRLLADGWQVAVCARRAPDRPVAADAGEAIFLQTDVRDPAAIEKLVTATVERFGRLDLLVNNAGGTPALTVAESSPELLHKIVALNLLAPLYLSRAAYNPLRHTRGSIVNVASISGVRAAPGTVAYGAAKAGLISATKGLAMEWGPDVRTNAVVIGLVENPDQIEHYGGPEGVARLGATLPMKRMARGHDVAACVAWLASPEAAYVSGAAIELHGGGEIPAFIELAQDNRKRRDGQ